MYYTYWQARELSLAAHQPMQNPLFPIDEEKSTRDAMLGHHSNAVPAANPAADLIRTKLSAIYAEEPSAKEELAEAKTETGPLSVHQAFVQRLQESGKPLAAVQTEWHNYYLALPDEQKHAVWQEFYATYNHRAAPHMPVVTAPQPQLDSSKGVVVAEHLPPLATAQQRRAPSSADLRRRIVGRVQTTAQLKPKRHLQSLAFGLSMGVLVVLIFLFGFFNEVIIAPFIQPSRTVSSTPLIVTAGSVPVSSTPEVIIPKINVEIPVDYSETSTNEAAIENDLENGVVHYPSTVMPGQQGNAAFFGHSSNNIFNPGKYKFAFVLLHTLVAGDTFYLTYNGQVYAYQVFSRQIVPPSDVGVLGNVPGKTATATLITCDPPGTSINRLVVVGEQISPSPSGNTAPATPTVSAATQPTALPGNGPTLWSRFWHWLF